MRIGEQYSTCFFYYNLSNQFQYKKYQKWSRIWQGNIYGAHCRRRLQAIYGNPVMEMGKYVSVHFVEKRIANFWYPVQKVSTQKCVRLVVHEAFREQIMRLHFENRCKIKCAVVAKQERVNLIKCLSLVHLFFSCYIIPSFLKSRLFEHSEEKQHILREIWFLASKISNIRSNPHSLIFHFWSRTEEDSLYWMV